MTMGALEELRRRGYSPRTLLDVGAHIGTFTTDFLAIFPACTPTLIEPNPFCQEDLARLSFERHAVAASDAPGRAELFLSREWLQSTGVSLYRENTQFFRDEVVVKHEVDKVRLDDLFADRHFDFVKIDTQGSELDVLRGGAHVLRQADYILVEVSLVEYNIGGARAEEVFAELAALGFKCADVTEFHRLRGVENGNLLQIDFLFERETRRQSLPQAAGLEGLKALARSFMHEGKNAEALLILEHLRSLEPRNVETLQLLARTAGAAGQPLRAIETLSALRAVTDDTGDYADDFRAQVPPAIERLNTHIAAGQTAEAEQYASALADLLPGSAEILHSALAASLALGRKDKALKYFQALQKLEAIHADAQAELAKASAADAEIPMDVKIAQVLSAAHDVHPLVRLRDLYDLASVILSGELDDRAAGQLRQLLEAARQLEVPVPQGSEFELWLKHYRLAIDAIDVTEAELPPPSGEERTAFATSAGRALDWSGVQKTAKRLGAETVFLAAADRKYVDLYARWYVNSILKHCDVPHLIILHVIGGADSLKEIAASIGIKDDRLILAGDDFKAGRVTTKCYDTPPKGLIEIPVAHFQSVRFMALGSLLRRLKLPVFVSDIDLLLQRGVRDLLEQNAGADVVLNRNVHSTSAGSRFTANLLLANPTDNALLFQGFLQAYLERALGKAEVSRWIDQFGLMMARHHLARHGTAPRIAYFDTNADINNVMYPSYQENPFRFLSLYHGFDMASLEGLSERPDEKSGAAAA